MQVQVQCLYVAVFPSCIQLLPPEKAVVKYNIYWREMGTAERPADFNTILIVSL